MTRSRSRGRVRYSTKYQDRSGGNLPARMLIVTEDEVTEVEYFDCLKSELDLGSDQVVVVSSGGQNSPAQIVEQACKRLRKSNEVFKYVYCVFDMDGKMGNFKKGIEAVQKMKKNRDDIEKIEAITSVPCFEFWLWLHDSKEKPRYEIKGNPCQKLKRQIKKLGLFKNYSTKGGKRGQIESIFSSLYDNRHKALEEAKLIFKNAEGVGEEIYSENPSTRVYVVLETLEKMSAEKKKAKRLENRNTR